MLPRSIDLQSHAIKRDRTPQLGGDLDAEGHKIEDLTNPTAAQDAATKAYADLHIFHSLATAVSDFLVASGSGEFVKKTLAETKTILGDPSKVIWLAEGVELLNLADQTTNVAFTDIDCTATTSADATFVLLKVQIHTDSYTSGRFLITFRRNGETPSITQSVEHPNIASTTEYIMLQVGIGLDAGNIFEYSTTFTGTCQIDVSLYALAYIE